MVSSSPQLAQEYMTEHKQFKNDKQALEGEKTGQLPNPATTEEIPPGLILYDPMHNATFYSNPPASMHCCKSAIVRSLSFLPQNRAWDSPATKIDCFFWWRVQTPRTRCATAAAALVSPKGLQVFPEKPASEERIITSLFLWVGVGMQWQRLLHPCHMQRIHALCVDRALPSTSARRGSGKSCPLEDGPLRRGPDAESNARHLHVTFLQLRVCGL